MYFSSRSIMKTLLVFFIVGSCVLIGKTNRVIYIILPCNVNLTRDVLFCFCSVGVCSDVEITTTEDPSSFNSTEEEKKFIQDWTRLFFSMSRIPRQGKQTLVFPGLFSESLIVHISCPITRESVTVVTPLFSLNR